MRRTRVLSDGSHRSVRASRSLLLVLAFALCSGTLCSQVFTYKRQSRLQAVLVPSLGLYAGHTGVDGVSGTSVNDVLRWGAGLTFDAGITYPRFTFSNRLRLEYQESHSTGQLPIKGPSTFEFTTRPLYKLLRDSGFDLDLALQAGCYSALLPETNSEGDVLRRFFDPASLYEGLFLSKENSYGEKQELQISFQIGYAFQQLVYKETAPNEISNAPEWANNVSSHGNGLASFLAMDFTPLNLIDQHQKTILAFSANLMIKAFRKGPGTQDLSDSRVEAFLRTRLSVFDLVDLVSGLEMIYDNAIAPRRELRTTVSINIRYNIDLSN